VGCRPLFSGYFPIRGAESDIAGYFTWFVSDTGKLAVFSPVKSDIDRRRLCVIQSGYEKSLIGFNHMEYRAGKFASVVNEEGILASPRLVVDVDFLEDLMDSQPDVQRLCVKATGLNLAELISDIAKLVNSLG
jgi:hypothetical protein